MERDITRRKALAALASTGALAGLASTGMGQSGGDTVASVGGGDMASNVSEHEVLFHQGPLSERPNPGVDGRYWVDDTGAVYEDTGSTWEKVEREYSELRTGSLGTKSRAADVFVWRDTDAGEYVCDDPDGEVARSTDETTVLQAALDAFPDEENGDGYTGILRIEPGRYRINSELVLPRTLKNSVITGGIRRGKGFASSGGVLLRSDGLSNTESLIRSQSGDADFSVKGLTFSGISFEGNDESGRLVDLPDADTVEFTHCNFRQNASGSLVRMYSSGPFDEATWGLVGKLEFRACEFAQPGGGSAGEGDYIHMQDTTQNLIMDCMFNYAPGTHITLRATDELPAGRHLNKTRIIGNEFNWPNDSGAAAGQHATLKLIGDQTNDHYVQDTIFNDNICVGEPNADAVLESNGHVRRTIFTGNNLIGSWNQKYNDRGEDSVYLNNGGSPKLELKDSSSQVFRIQKNDGGSTAFTNEDAKPFQFWAGGSLQFQVSQGGFVDVGGGGIRGLENVDNVSAAGDLVGDLAIDEAQERLYLKDDAGNLGYIALDGVFT